MRPELRRRGLVVAVLVVLLAGFASAAFAQRARKGGAPKAESDIVVVLILANGQTVQYSSEVRKLQLVLDAQGHLATIHLVLAKGPETDTHEWYNYRNLAGFSYRYLEITGRAKVSVLRTEVVPPMTPVEEKVPALMPGDYL